MGKLISIQNSLNQHIRNKHHQEWLKNRKRRESKKKRSLINEKEDETDKENEVGN